MNREIRKLSKKIDELQKQINYQNECIMDQSIIIQKLVEKLVVIPTVESKNPFYDYPPEEKPHQPNTDPRED